MWWHSVCPESLVVEYLGITSFWCRDLRVWRCGVFQRFSDLTTSFVSNFLETKVAWCLNLWMSQLHVICLSTFWFWILWIHFGSFVSDHCVVFNAAVSTFGHHHMFWAQCVKFDWCTHFEFVFSWAQYVLSTCKFGRLPFYSVQVWHLVVWAFWIASTFQLYRAWDWCSICCVMLYGQCDAR